jgi:hypothetical protein
MESGFSRKQIGKCFHVQGETLLSLLSNFPLNHSATVISEWAGTESIGSLVLCFSLCNMILKENGLKTCKDSQLFPC